MLDIQSGAAASTSHVVNPELQTNMTVQTANHEHCLMHQMSDSCSGCPVCSGFVTYVVFFPLHISNDWLPLLEIGPRDPVSGDRFRPPIA